MQYLNNPSQFLVAWPRLPGACSLERSGGHFGFVSWDWSLVCCCSTRGTTQNTVIMDNGHCRVKSQVSSINLQTIQIRFVMLNAIQTIK